MTSKRELAGSFDKIALDYDRHRPGYPAELFRELESVAKLGAGSRLLEIGCGTGKATMPFARKGYRMLCLDPGANMMELAQAKCRGMRNVLFMNESFEDALLPAESFDLIFAAQSFHWIDLSVAYRKTAALLRPGGYLALFWHVSPPGTEAKDIAAQLLFQKHIKRAKPQTPASFESSIVDGFLELCQSGYYLEHQLRRYSWAPARKAPPSLEERWKALSTWSELAAMSGKRRAALKEEWEALMKRPGKESPERRETILYIGRKPLAVAKAATLKKAGSKAKKGKSKKAA